MRNCVYYKLMALLHITKRCFSQKNNKERNKKMGIDMQSWRLLHDKHMPWPCIVNSIKKNFACTCLCFHSGNHKSITLGRQTCVPRFMCGMVVWWEQDDEWTPKDVQPELHETTTCAVTNKDLARVTIPDESLQTSRTSGRPKKPTVIRHDEFL